MTYLMAYCVYTGASTTVQDVRDGDNSALEKIQTYIRALTGSCKTCPGVQRSLDIIQNSITNLTNDAQLTLTRPEQLTTFLPAFPRSDLPSTTIQGNDDELYNFDAFAMLECFPEEHFDQLGSDWYFPSPNFG